MADPTAHRSNAPSPTRLLHVLDGGKTTLANRRGAPKSAIQAQQSNSENWLKAAYRSVATGRVPER